VANVKKSASKPESKELAADFENKVQTMIAEWKEINGQEEEHEKEEAENSNSNDDDGENNMALMNTSNDVDSVTRKNDSIIKEEHDNLTTAVERLQVT